LRAIDKFSFQVLEETQENAKNLDAETFNSIIAETFSVVLANQQQVELCPGGSEKYVQHDNVDEYVHLATQALL